MKDKNGRPLTKQQTQRPKWSDEDMGVTEVAGFKLLQYLGYFRKTPESKGQHWYKVRCMTCETEYKRIQGALNRGVARGSLGCHKCAKHRHERYTKAKREQQENMLQERLQEWLWVNFIMPATSIRIRAELGKCFDSEHTIIKGWRTI